MRTRLVSIAILLGIVGFHTLPLNGQESPSVPQLFEQLKSDKTTNRAALQFLKLGPENQAARTYLAQRLPGIINAEPKSHYAWINSVRLAGAFRITETIPGLIKWIYAETEEGGNLAQDGRLDPFPCAKALVQIGEPAIPALTETLENGDSGAHWFAYRALFLIGTPHALNALREHVNREANPDLKMEMQKALAEK